MKCHSVSDFSVEKWWLMLMQTNWIHLRITVIQIAEKLDIRISRVGTLVKDSLKLREMSFPIPSFETWAQRKQIGSNSKISTALWKEWKQILDSILTYNETLCTPDLKRASMQWRHPSSSPPLIIQTTFHLRKSWPFSFGIRKECFTSFPYRTDNYHCWKIFYDIKEKGKPSIRSKGELSSIQFVSFRTMITPTLPLWKWKRCWNSRGYPASSFI